jgi:phospholipase C
MARRFLCRHQILHWSKYALSYFDGSVIPNYWEYASSFTLCDAFFSSLIGPSAPNHLYGIAGQSGGMVNNYKMTMPPLECFNFSQTPLQPVVITQNSKLSFPKKLGIK